MEEENMIRFKKRHQFRGTSKVFYGLTAVFGLWLVGSSTDGLAQTRSQVYGSSLTRQTMTAYVQDDVSMNTYDSEAAGSKEVAQSNTWCIGTYAGEGRDLGILFRSSDNIVPFALNQSYLRANFKDTVMQWRLGWVYPALAAGLTEIETSSTENGNFNLYGANIGAGVGVFIPLFAKSVFYVNSMVYQTPNAWDKSGKDVKLGQRLEQDIGASIDLTENVIDLMVGYRTRQYKVTSGEKTFNEITLGAYAGLRLGLYF
jgi:hypothetical protein